MPRKIPRRRRRYNPLAPGRKKKVLLSPVPPICATPAIEVLVERVPHVVAHQEEDGSTEIHAAFSDEKDAQIQAKRLNDFAGRKYWHVYSRS